MASRKSFNSSKNDIFKDQSLNGHHQPGPLVQDRELQGLGENVD